MVLNGLGTSAYQAVIQLSVFDMFFAHERGRMLSVYLFGQQLGSMLVLTNDIERMYILTSTTDLDSLQAALLQIISGGAGVNTSSLSSMELC